MKPTFDLLEQKFLDACRIMHRHPVAKLLKPGPHKFIRRIAARQGVGGGPVEINLFFGEKMAVVLPEIISEALYTYGLFDETVTWMIMQTVKPGNTVLDIGAHFGYLTLLMDHLAGKEGRVVSFEPTPSTYEILSRNTRNHPRIKVLNLAAGNSSSRIQITDFGLRYSAWNTLSGTDRMSVPDNRMGKPVEVEVVRCDDICQTLGLRPDFIKIDAENYEDKVVAGLAGIIATCKPTVLMESGSPQSLAAARELVHKGYDLRVCERPGNMDKWTGTLEQANESFKDILFVPQT